MRLTGASIEFASTGTPLSRRRVQPVVANGRIVVRRRVCRVSVMRSWARRTVERFDGASDRVFTAGVVLAGIASSFLLMVALVSH